MYLVEVGGTRAAGRPVMPEKSYERPEIGLSGEWIEVAPHGRVCECCGRHPVRALLYREDGALLEDFGVCDACRRQLCPDSGERGCGLMVDGGPRRSWLEERLPLADHGWMATPSTATV